MTLRLTGSIGTFFLVVLGLMYNVGQFSVTDFLIFLGLGTVAGLIAWFKLFKPNPHRESR